MSSRSRRWIHREVALAIHEAQIREHGGSLGLRDLGLLESALERPRNADDFSSARPGVPELSALYAIAIIRNHPFVDGNKRVALVLMELFLSLNAYELVASDAECLEAVVSLAARVLTDAEFTAWVKDHARGGRRRRAARR